MHRRPIIAVSAFTAIGLALVAIALLRVPGPLSVAILIDELTEKLTLVAGMAAIAWTVTELRDVRESQTALTNNVARSIAQGDAWRDQRRGEIAALGRAIEEQFMAWRLSGAEIDIAGLMLKGASLKEIALARDTSEATIRQQAQSIYRKSGLSGRAELSAYFLESLFSTAEDAAERRAGLSVVGGGSV